MIDMIVRYTQPTTYIHIKRALTLLLLGVLVWVAVEAGLLLRLYRQESGFVLQDVKSVTGEAKDAARAFKTVADLQAAQLTDPKTQRSLGLLLRTGDDLSRTVMKVNSALDKTNQALATVNTETLPRVNQTLDGANALILKCSDGVTLVLSDTDETIKQIRQLLQSPEIKQALQGFADTATHTSGIAQNVEFTSGDLRSALPALLEQIKTIQANVADSSQAVAQLLGRLNRPVSKKERVFQFLLRLLIAGGPTAAQVLR